MAQVYPIMLDVSNSRIVIVGGGAVAARKATGLTAAGATRIRVVAPGFPGDFSQQVEKVTKRYEASDLEDADLVFAATDSAAINDQIVRDAQAIGVWVNRADGSDEHPGDFTNPALLEAGPIAITISAGSPALATVIRDQLRERIEPQWIAMAQAMRELRPAIKAEVNLASRRAEIFRSMATKGGFAVLRERGVNALKDWVFAEAGFGSHDAASASKEER